MTLSPFSATWRPDVARELDTLGAGLAEATSGLASKQPSSAVLSAVAALDSTAGILVQTGATAFAKRSLASSDLTISNPNGAAGNPTLNVGTSLTPDKAFRRGNILGAVSQSGGVPSGAIIEHGNNSNGNYARFADGTQICWFVQNLTGVTPTARAEGNITGGAYFDTFWSFPAAFATSPTAIATPTSIYMTTGAVRVFSGVSGSASASTMSVRYWALTTFDNVSAHLVAAGRWF